MAGKRLSHEVAAQVVELRKTRRLSWRRIADKLDISASGAMYAYERATKPVEVQPEPVYRGGKTGPKPKSNSKDFSEYDGANWSPYLKLIFGASRLSV